MTAHLAGTAVLETERLVLRAPRAADLPGWQAFSASPRSEFVPPYDYDEGAAWAEFSHVIGHWVLRGYGMFVFTLKGEDAALGMAGPWYPAGWHEREIAWTIWSEASEGKGYAFEAAAAARAYAFDTLGWTAAVSYMHPDNTRSITLAERMGAALDPTATHPFDGPTVVYRHPKPGAAA